MKGKFIKKIIYSIKSNNFKVDYIPSEQSFNESFFPIHFTTKRLK